ncbi:hypothetical protein JQ604_02755 [Bradyrhizobium jicamae]|uniref:hypothetical protein n=1 Tax=Bradyrhizobium jicamae TaxID=280332 RepID=UPI001BA8D819|nr:hypothetical protein [Bradyrhizobium jicamae]MBR0751089.1 hypothetical protein [Bradyrhizobium jicamae]
MAKFTAVAAAVLLSGIVLAPPAFGQASEPAAYQAAHPDRDVLNGGALTPWGAEQAARNGAGNAYGAYGAMQTAPAPGNSERPLPVRRYRHVPRS